MAHWILLADAGAGIDVGRRRAGAEAGSWALFAVTMLLLLVGIALAIATRKAPAQIAYAIRGFKVVIGLPLAVTGFVLTRRLPGNPLGWLMAAVALLMGVLFTADGYAIAAIIDGWDLPAGQYAAWLVNWLWEPSVSALGVFVLLLYPDGRLPSRRWRPVAIFSVAATIVGIAVTTLVDGSLESSRAAGAGMRNMTDRVDAVSGTLEVESSAGAGTCVRGRVPVAQ